MSIETAQRCRTISFKSDYLGSPTLDQYTSLEFFLCLRPTVPLLKFQGNRICRFRDRSSMTDELTVNQLDPVPDLSPNSRSSTAHRGPRDGCDGCDGSLMAGISRGASRASDDGTLMTCTIQAAVPKLSLGEPQPEELEQELGQPPRRRPSSSLGRACPSSCSGASA